MIQGLRQDIRYALRILIRSPVFSCVAICMLAFGIGVNTAVFSLLDAVLLRHLPVSDPQHLVLLEWSAHKAPKAHEYSSFQDCAVESSKQSPRGCSFSYPFFDSLKEQSALFDGIAAFAGAGRVNVATGGQADLARGELVSGDFFRTVGIRMASGRAIQPQDDNPGAAPVAVLSFGYWQRMFGGGPTTVGQTIRVNDIPFYIVGVVGSDFAEISPGNGFDILLPLSQSQRLKVSWSGNPDDIGNWWLVVLGRIKQDVSTSNAQVALSVAFRNQVASNEESLFSPADDPKIGLVSAAEGLSGQKYKYNDLLYILMLSAGLVLLVACGNLAGLILSRMASREKEIVVRLAIGASRFRLARQLFAESLILSFVGGVLAILLAHWTAPLLAALTIRHDFHVRFDARVLIFSALISVVTGILFAVIPIFWGRRPDLSSALKDSVTTMGRSRAGRRRLTLRDVLVVGQIAFSIVLLFAAGILVRTFKNLDSIDPGFDVRNLLLFRLDPTLLPSNGINILDLYRDVQAEIRRIPGVTAVSYSSYGLLSGSLSSGTLSIDGLPGEPDVRADILAAGPGFFETMEIPVLEGRVFDDRDFERWRLRASKIAMSASRGEEAKSDRPVRDKRDSPPNTPVLSPDPVIVNEMFVRHYLQSKYALGISLSGLQLVGVVKDTKFSNLRSNINPTVYKMFIGGGAYFEVRTAIDPKIIVPTVRQVVRELNPDLPVFGITTQVDQIRKLFLQERLVAILSSIFALLSLLLSCSGLYGLLSYEVTQRTREIAIHMAVGARPSDVLQALVRRGIGSALLGTALGVLLILTLSRYLSKSLYGITASDPATLLETIMLLFAVALIACYLPARRIVYVDPIEALRHE